MACNGGDFAYLVDKDCKWRRDNEDDPGFMDICLLDGFHCPFDVPETCPLFEEVGA